MGDNTKIEWTDSSWNPTRGCTIVSDGCRNCLDPETPILMADMSWRPIGDIVPGDKVVGFTDKPVKGQNRTYELATVVENWQTSKPAIEITAAGRTVVASEDHLFLSHCRPYWRPSEKLTLQSQIIGIGMPSWVPDISSQSYLAGYAAGVIAGDGTMRIAGSGKNGTKQSYCRVAVLASDKPILDRLVTALLAVGCTDINIRSFDAGPGGGFTHIPQKPMLKVETRKKDNLILIRDVCQNERGDLSWRAGFLAGFLDTGGSYSSSNLRFHQSKREGYLDVVNRCVQALGFESTREDFRSSEGRSERLCGNVEDKIRFLSTIRPALLRKANDWNGRRFPAKQGSRVDSVRRVGVRDLVDIETSSGTFIANGFAVHNCYAMKDAYRFNGEGLPYEGLTRISGGRPVWTGKIMLVTKNLDQPIRWQRPRRIFTNSMSDVFHEKIPFEYIAAIFGVMAAAKHHQFQVLTKRPERMVEFFNWLMTRVDHGHSRAEECRAQAMKYTDHKDLMGYDLRWPLPNVWLGVSVEDQESADARVKLLTQVPARVRFLSAEPLLGPIKFGPELGQIHWIICGGESGPGSRPCKQEWVESILYQTRAVGGKFFFKQKGELWAKDCGTAHKKGGDIDDFPDHLKVREYPVAL